MRRGIGVEVRRSAERVVVGKGEFAVAGVRVLIVDGLIH
jgi:hypothetical protein